MNHDTDSILNNLIETCKDGEQGYLTCSENATSPELKTLFASQARERGALASELQQQAQSLGITPETRGSISGAIHRGWVDLKAAITGQDDLAILNECERGEDAALKAYRSALAKEMPQPLREIVARQAESVQRAHDQIKALRNRHRAADSAGLDAGSASIGHPGSAMDSQREIR